MGLKFTVRIKINNKHISGIIKKELTLKFMIFFLIRVIFKAFNHKLFFINNLSLI